MKTIFLKMSILIIFISLNVQATGGGNGNNGNDFVKRIVEEVCQSEQSCIELWETKIAENCEVGNDKKCRQVLNELREKFIGLGGFEVGSGNGNNSFQLDIGNGVAERDS